MKNRKLLGQWILGILLTVPVVLAFIYPHSGWAVLVGIGSFVMCFVPIPKTK
jgi:hypothetical protein